MKYIISLIFLCLTILPGLAETPKVPVKFRVDTFSQDSQNYLVLSYLNHPKWHTYWKNPGDSGLETKYEILINGEKVELEEYGWPTPKKYIEQGNLLAYGYENGYSFFFKLSSEQLQSWNGKELKVESKWLVCKNICIPGKASVTGNFANANYAQSAQDDFEISKDVLTKRLNEIPTPIDFPSNLDIVLSGNVQESSLTLYYSYGPSLNGSINDHQSMLIPFPLSPFDFKREELKKDSKGHFYGKFPIAWDGEYSEPVVEFPKDGKFQSPYTLRFLFLNPETQKSAIVEKTFSSFKLDSQSSESFFQSIQKGDSGKSNKQVTSANKKQEAPSLFYYLIMAFFGGLILNVMPCVLPVISLKLFGLIKYQDHSRAQIFKHNMFYTLGVILTFMVLAVVVLILKSSGETVGWGFQLQSPNFVAIMAIVIFIFALSMFGLYEFRVPGGHKIAAMQGGDGPMGHIFEGVLATILSTPCSAPFLGTALTFAFTSGTVGILGMFLVIGIGLSFPFIFTAFFPGSIKILPKPGKWMNKLKIFLALTLILTMVWLIDIYNVLVDSSSALIELLTVITLIFFAVFYSSKYSKKFAHSLLSFVLPLAMTLHLLSLPINATGSVQGNVSMLKDKQASGIKWERWSEEKMNQYKASGKQVFIDFTAKWCFTCKVNEKLVIDTKSFKDLIESTNTVPLLADWTKRDEKIGKWLESHGLVGVPAYFIIKKDGTLVSLGETITLDEIKKNLD